MLQWRYGAHRHPDVTPVLEDTLDQWIHPPFSGHFDGTWIWGRGSCDDKSGLISIMYGVLMIQGLLSSTERGLGRQLS